MKHVFHNQLLLLSISRSKIMTGTISTDVITANYSIVTLIEFILAALSINAKKILHNMTPNNGGEMAFS